MCLGGGGGGSAPVQDNSAQIAREEEAVRKQDVVDGKGIIDNAFSVFNPDYFSKYENDYKGVYNPQIDQQYEDAQRTLRYGVARKGVQDSTPGIESFSRLGQAYADKRAEVAGNALEAVNKAKSNIENTRSTLYSQNIQAADPAQVATQAAGQVGALQTPPTYSPIGDVFGSLLNSAGAYVYGRQQGRPEVLTRAFTPGGGLPSSGGSGRVVN